MESFLQALFEGANIFETPDGETIMLYKVFPSYDDEKAEKTKRLCTRIINLDEEESLDFISKNDIQTMAKIVLAYIRCAKAGMYLEAEDREEVEDLLVSLEFEGYRDEPCTQDADLLDEEF